MTEDVRKRICEAFSEIRRDPDYRKQMTEQGLEIVDITYDKMGPFLEERRKTYLAAAKLLGLAK